MFHAPPAPGRHPLVLATPALAHDPATVAAFQASGVCTGRALASADRAGEDLSGKVLTEADLSGADLCGAQMPDGTTGPC